VRLRVAQALAENGLPAELVHDLWPRAAADEPTTVATDLNFPASPPSRRDSGSNGWVVHGERTASGKPILANDPHLRFGAPILWYLAHIEAPGLRLTGATVPGVPFMILGHNGAIAWGMTNGGGDVEDLFIETVDPGDPDSYLTPDGPRPFRKRREIVRVKDAEPVEFTVRETRHGPVMSDLLETLKSTGKVAALATPALRGDDRTVEALFRINQARDWPAFEAAARDFHTPHTNLFFASTRGDIGFVSSGRIPLRKSGTGFAPVPGADGAHDWTGFISMADLPRRHNPPSGWIANANNRVVGDDYPYSIAANWGPPYRAERIAETLERQKAHDIAASRALQRDTLSTAARRLLPLMLAAPPKDARQREAMAMLSAWNYEMRRDRPEPLIYATWLRHLAQALIADEIGGGKARAFQSLVNRPGAGFIAVALSGRQVWCDDIATPDMENCADRLSMSLSLALDELAASLGADMRAWRWGALHRAAFAHPVLTHVPVVARFADLGIETDGGDHTVNRGMTAGQGHANPLAHLDGSGYRAIYDLADLDNSRFVIATGQSGNPLSPHYGDFLQRWRDGEYIKISAGPPSDKDGLRLVPGSK
jgi:penicillin amidase